MNRSSGNVSAKKLMTEPANNAKASRKTFEILPESSSISSNRNSSAQSEEEVNAEKVCLVEQVNNNSLYQEQELMLRRLQAQVKELRHKLKMLEESVECKEYSLGTISREKDRAVGEVRRLEKTNKQLRQQLNDERNYYIEEKEKFCEEMTRYKKRLQEVRSSDSKKQNSKWTFEPFLVSRPSLRWHFDKDKGDFADNKSVHLKASKSQKLTDNNKGKPSPLRSFSCSDSQLRKTESLESLHLYDGNDQSLQMAALRTENAKLRSIICERDEKNYELCLRFLRMKHCKNDIRSRFQDLETEYLQVITNLMEKIDEARQEFNFIIDQKFKKPLHSTNAMYLRLVQRNSRMAFENASLRLENQCLKKELKKYVSGDVSELISRKIDQTKVPDAKSETKTMCKNSKSDSKLKKSKKNVNFKEIRMIYERNLSFKNSDTDSNYMSKTSTTVRSNGSLTDRKSNESIPEGSRGESDSGKIPSSPFHPNSLPDEILNKIFKRVDTASCLALDRDPSPPPKASILAIGHEDLDDDETGHGHRASLSRSDKCDRSKEDATTSTEDSAHCRNGLSASKSASGEQKHPNLTDSTTPCDSKESIRLKFKDSMNLPPYTPSEMANFAAKVESMTSFEKEAYFRGTDGSSRMRPVRSVSKYMADSDLAEASSSIDYSTYLGTNWQEKVPSNREWSRTQRFERSVKDSCGLQERFDMSYQELPPTAESNTQTLENMRQDEEDEGRVDREVIDDSVEERRRRDLFVSDNLIGFSDDAEADPKNTESCELLSVQETHANPPITYRIERNDSTFFKEGLSDITESTYFTPDFTEYDPQRDSARSRRTEGSKRFSHRLISTSPEQLRNILTDSQLETCYRMAPIIVGHATTEVNSPYTSLEPNKDIILQLVIPADKVHKSSQMFLENVSGNEGSRETVDKETSMVPLTPDTVPNQTADPCSSGIRIPVSNMPTSTSTMDLVDSGGLNDRSNIMLRTLSAPGLLESSWLDPYTICEMRDCSTNT